MQSLLLQVLLLAALTGTALSHGMVETYDTSAGTHNGFKLDYYYAKANKRPVPDTASWYTENLDSGFVSPAEYGSPDINCHKAATPGTLTTDVEAGSDMTFHWAPAPWAHPFGPIVTYLASCGGDCTQADKTALEWVKIQADGVDFNTQKWASKTLIEQNGSWKATIPASLAPGNYVIRHEIIALHGARELNGAQNYPQCINIAVTGSGTKQLPAGTLGTALYKNNDPGIMLDPYAQMKSYPMPGPELWTG